MKHCIFHNPFRNIRFKEYSRVTEVDTKEWNKVTLPHLFLSIDFLKVQEQLMENQMGFNYVLIYEHERLLGLAFFQEIHIDHRETNKYVKDFLLKDSSVTLRRAVDGVFEHHENFFSAKLVICGNVLVSGIYTIACVDPSQKQKLYDALCYYMEKKMDTKTDDKKITFSIFKDFPTLDHNLSATFEDSRYHGFSPEPVMLLPDLQRWKNMLEYSEAISKKYRKRYKTITAKGSQLIRKSLNATEIKALNKPLYALYKQVVDQSGFNLSLVPLHYFETWKAALPEQFSFIAYFLEDQPVAFRCTFIDGNTLFAHFIGLDYQLNKEHEIYQNILYDLLEEALEKGATVLNYGRTAPEIKSNIGAIPVHAKVYARHRKYFANRFLKPMLEAMPAPSWTPRDPFRASDIMLTKETVGDAA